MEKRIIATQAVRDFYELLNRIKFNGDHYIIERRGKPVALMEPIKESSTLARGKYGRIILDTSVLVEAERGPLDIEIFVNGREEEPERR